MCDKSIKYEITEEDETKIKAWIDYPVPMGYEYIITHEITADDIIKIITSVDNLKEVQNEILENVNCRICDYFTADKSAHFCLEKGEIIDGEDYYKLAKNCEFFTGKDLDV